MYWWKRFDASEVSQDFAAIRSVGFECVRIFLLWEDFQPDAEVISKDAIDQLVTVAQIAADESLDLIPTLFTGHMSGVNWIPQWALNASARPQRFRIVAKGKVVDAAPRNWYTDQFVLQAQTRFASEVADALRDRKSIWAWDLGNENSNCVIPPNRDAGLEWLERITAAIRSADPNRLITTGLHMEDLEEDRKIGPAEAATYCDFLCMHGYPIYCSWSKGKTDSRLLPFLGLITEWLGGKRVLFEEFGAPTFPTTYDEELSKGNVTLLTETEATDLTESILSQLSYYGLIGGLVWCYADYARALWKLPPLDQAVHERYFGLWRSDRSEKLTAQTIRNLRGTFNKPAVRNFDWINIKRDKFYDSPIENLKQLYRRFQLDVAAAS